MALVSGSGSEEVRTLVGEVRLPRTLAGMLVGAGLLQLVTGVLHHLLPTLLGGGPAKVTLGRKVADRGGDSCFPGKHRACSWRS